jgi:hypothetical protein
VRCSAFLETAVGVGVVVLLTAHARVFDAGQAWATAEMVAVVVSVVVSIVVAVVVAVGGVVGGVVGAVVSSRRSDRLVVRCGVDDVGEDCVDESCRDVARVAVMEYECGQMRGRFEA